MIPLDDDLEYIQFTDEEKTTSKECSAIYFCNGEKYCKCGTIKNASINLLLGFIFPLFWCSGCYVCCKNAEDLKNTKIYYIYVAQLFLLLIFSVSLFCYVISSGIINSLFVLPEIMFINNTTFHYYK